MTEWLHPAPIMIVGGILLPLTGGHAQKIASLLFPLLAVLGVATLRPGTYGAIDFAGLDLVLFQVDKLSLLFGWVLR